MLENSTKSFHLAKIDETVKQSENNRKRFEKVEYNEKGVRSIYIERTRTTSFFSCVLREQTEKKACVLTLSQDVLIFSLLKDRKKITRLKSPR